MRNLWNWLVKVYRGESLAKRLHRQRVILDEWRAKHPGHQIGPARMARILGLRRSERTSGRPDDLRDPPLDDCPLEYSGVAETCERLGITEFVSATADRPGETVPAKECSIRFTDKRGR